MLIDILKNSSLCSRCNYCRVCPVYSVEGWESASPRGKLYVINCIENGFPLNIEIAREFFKCTTCGNCEVVCQLGIPLVSLWESFRRYLNERGYLLPIHRKLKERTLKEWNPYGESRNMRANWLNVKISKDSDLLYFAGCTASYRTVEIAKSTVELFKKVGLDFNYAGVNEYCCGSPFFRTGQMDIAKKLFLKNLKIWKEMKVKRIVTSCAGCYRTIAKDYPLLAEKFNYDFDFEVLHTVQLLEEIVKDFNSSKLSFKATYHDPCHLGRHMDVYDEPRRVIKKLGIDLVEMDRNREKAFCCGAGGGVKSQFKDLSFEIGKIRANEALKTNADYLLSCCPFCKLHLSQSLSFFDKKMIVADLVEVVNKSMQ